MESRLPASITEALDSVIWDTEGSFDPIICEDVPDFKEQLTITRVHDYIDFCIDKQDEQQLRICFGFDTDSIDESTQNVMGFLVASETDSTATLRIRRPQLINQMMILGT